MATTQNSQNNLPIYIIMILSLITNGALGYIFFKADSYKKELSIDVYKKIEEINKLELAAEQAEQQKELTIDEITKLQKEFEKIEKAKKQGKDVDITLQEALDILNGK